MENKIEVDGNYLADLEHKAAWYRDARAAAHKAFKTLGIDGAGQYPVSYAIEVLLNAVLDARRHEIAPSDTVNAAHGE